MRLACLMIVLVPMVACSAPEKAPASVGFAPIAHIGIDSKELLDDLTAKMMEAHVDMRLELLRDVPASERPDWVDDSDAGLLLFVAEEQQERARGVLSAWMAGLKEAGDAAGVPPQAVPMELGTEKPLSTAMLAVLGAELSRRAKLDQDVRRNPARHGEMGQVDADNTAWLKRIVREHGWVDAERFGPEAANAAFLLVQHSGDLGLMLAALPRIEQDVRAGRLDGQNYALLYDRTQLMTGGKQRYGSQIMQDDQGGLVVTRLEDPDRVDEFRAEIGMIPLSEYLKLFGAEVRIER